MVRDEFKRARVDVFWSGLPAVVSRRFTLSENDPSAPSQIMAGSLRFSTVAPKRRLEARGVEPLSSSLSAKTSTCVFGAWF
jgi:hypothetical protein